MKFFASVCLRNKKGKTALHKASKFAYCEMVRALIAAGAQLDLQDDNGCTALMLAREFDSASALIDAGCNLRLRDSRVTLSP